MVQIVRQTVVDDKIYMIWNVTFNVKKNQVDSEVRKAFRGKVVQQVSVQQWSKTHKASLLGLLSKLRKSKVQRLLISVPLPEESHNSVVEWATSEEVTLDILNYSLAPKAFSLLFTELHRSKNPSKIIHLV